MQQKIDDYTAHGIAVDVERLSKITQFAKNWTVDIQLDEAGGVKVHAAIRFKSACGKTAILMPLKDQSQ